MVSASQFSTVCDCFQAWARFMKRNVFVSALVCLLSIPNTASIRLLSSRMGNFGVFSGPLSETADYRAVMCGLLCLVLEDFPQLVIQIIVIRSVMSSSL